MMVGVDVVILNEDGTIAMKVHVEENVPLTDRNPEVNGGRALMRCRELVTDAVERIEAQARTLGLGV